MNYENHPYSYMRWHRLVEVSRGGEVVELEAASSCDGIPVIARWTLTESGWKVEAMDGESCEWAPVSPEEVESGEECVPLTPPPIWSDSLMESLRQADKVLDDIDTAGDAFKPEHSPYFKYVARRCQEGEMRKRREILGIAECQVGPVAVPPET